ncbi:MAG: hypothetical protein ABIR33_12915 [Pyrinomonadaceae bacterium]
MKIYIGTFLIAFSTLALEITLTRILSVTTWYHLAFFAISTAMLGMTAGATTVYLKKREIERRSLDDTVALSCLGYAIVLPVALALICLIPVKLEPTLMPVLSLLLITALCTTPFYFSGVALSVLLTKYDLPIGRIYAVDLIGAALGCLFVLAGLEVFSAPTLVLICSFIGAMAAFVFAFGSTTFRNRKLLIGVSVVLFSLVTVNSLTHFGIYQYATKGNFVSIDQILIEKWNSFSRVVVLKPTEQTPPYWGPSPNIPKNEITTTYPMNIDGDAFTSVRKFSSPADIENLRYDITNIAYFLRPSGGACIIGVGGGRDLQSALLFGQERVLGIDVNPVFIDLQHKEFRSFAGLGANPAVRLVSDEARSYLTQTDETFSVIQMSMIDTWAATGAGAFSLSENGLYTVEGWNVFYDRLADNGIFTVSRWFNPDNPAETGRILSLAVTMLLRRGIADPFKHVALVTVGKISTLLLSKRAFGSDDISRLRSVSSEMQYDVLVAPGLETPSDILGRIVSARSESELFSVIKDAPYNFEPSTDESPYFFNLLRLTKMDLAFRSSQGVARGNLLATITLVGLIGCLTVLSAITVLIPLFSGIHKQKTSSTVEPAHLLGAIYFCLIGAGFMFAEIAIIQKLTVFLGHPIYALGILLFTIIASTGMGSFLSEVIPGTKRWFMLLPILVAVVILGELFVLSFLVTQYITQPIFSKAILCIAAIFPLGVLLGIFFPRGMRLFKPLVAGDTPWFWALNGIFGVLSSATAVFVSIYFGISVNFYVAAACYLLILPVVIRAAGLYTSESLSSQVANAT